MGKDKTRADLVFGELDKLARRIAKKSGDDLWTNMGRREPNETIVTVSSTFDRNRRVTFIYGGTRLVVYVGAGDRCYRYLDKRGRGKFLTTGMVKAWQSIVGDRK